MIQLKDINKTYNNGAPLHVLKGIDLDIRKGEFVSIMGASGSGKSTLLNILGILDNYDTGEYYLNGTLIKNLSENKAAEYRNRMIGFIFQSFNLISFKDAVENVALPLFYQGVSRRKRNAMALEYLERLGLKEWAHHMPNEMSGGQKQRVAIARALANNPRVLLLDEPLGALDLQLRRTMQLELKRLQKKLGITFIYITHDQEEAINMSDRIVVMNQGQFEQIGTPDEIYNHPKTSYVATFVGNANILKGKVVEINGSYAQVQIGNDTVSVYTEEIVKVGEQLTLAVRSENILLDEAEMENVVEQNEAEGTGRHLHATVKEKNFAAGQLRVLLALSDGTELTASRFGMNANIQPGQQIKWYFDPRNAIVVDREFKTKEPADMSGGNQ